jgi:PKD repeat protein
MPDGKLACVRPALVCVLALALAPAAGAAAPVVSATVSATTGRAPLDVTLRADGDAASYRWNLGDGSAAEGPVVRHVYARPGVYTAVVTAVSAGGETATATVTVSAFRLTLVAPRSARLAQRVRFHGRLAPPLVGAPVALRRGKLLVARTRTGTGGRFVLPVRIGAPGPWTARWSSVRSAPRMVRIRPELAARLAGGGTVGSRLQVVARVRPAAAGRVRIEIRSGGRLRRVAELGPSGRLTIGTEQPGAIRVRVALVPRPGYGRAVRGLATTVVQPHLALGSRGASVRALEARLRELRYALRGADGLYGLDTVEAVLAFQKVEGLPWTGRVDATVWRRLASAHVPRARFRGDHIEISKGRQVLLLVRDGLVTTVVHVSTGATGNTPIGAWHVYRKVVGWDWVLWYPMYFLRGFAIHGYPSVPAYPASHGCVRVPMWIAPTLYAANPYGQTVYVYW